MESRRTAFYTYESRDFALPLQVISIGLEQDQRPIRRENGYDSFHFFRCIAGAGAVEAGSHSFALKPGMCMILYPHETHCYYPTEEPWLVDWITFDGNSAATLLAYLEIERSDAFDMPRPADTSEQIRAMRELINAQPPTVKMDLSCRMYQLLSGLYWKTGADGSASRDIRYRRLEPVLRYIEENYNRPLTLELLAARAGVSPKHLCLLFHDILHVRPFWHINTVRVNNCKRMLLEDRSMTIQAAAALCGYENVSYFNQTFRAVAGMSPTEFRRQH